MRRVLVAVSLLLAGCGATMQGNMIALPASSAPSHIQQALSDLADFSLSDLQWASKDAHARNDIIFYTCWDGLVPIVTELRAARQANGGALPSFPTGVASGVQILRDVIHGAAGGAVAVGSAAVGPSVVDRIVVACAGMSQAIIADQLKVAANIGSVMSGVGAAPAALNALKGIAPILKLMPLPIPLQ